MRLWFVFKTSYLCDASLNEIWRENVPGTRDANESRCLYMRQDMCSLVVQEILMKMLMGACHGISGTNWYNIRYGRAEFASVSLLFGARWRLWGHISFCRVRACNCRLNFTNETGGRERIARWDRKPLISNVMRVNKRSIKRIFCPGSKPNQSFRNDLPTWQS